MADKKSEFYEIGRKAMESMIEALKNDKPLTKGEVVMDGPTNSPQKPNPAEGRTA